MTPHEKRGNGQQSGSGHQSSAHSGSDSLQSSQQYDRQADLTDGSHQKPSSNGSDVSSAVQSRDVSSPVNSRASSSPVHHGAGQPREEASPIPKSNIRQRLGRQRCMFCILQASAFMNISALVGVCLFLLWNGIPVLSWEFLTSVPTKGMTAGGIWPCIVGTLLLSLGALVIAFPVGVASAVYLHEYAGRSRFSAIIRLGVNNLAGVPSIVFGLFGTSFFVIYCGLGISLLAGILTLAILTLPVIIGTAEEALRQVPMTYREASSALGATQSQTIFRVILPASMPGMLTGAILGLARAAGETAAIMFTGVVFFNKAGVDSLFGPVMALSNHIYVLATAGMDIDKTMPLQYGTALVLVVLVLGMNGVAIIVRDRMQQTGMQ